MSSDHLSQCHKTETDCLDFPQYELGIWQHFDQLYRSCCFHKLAHMHLNTIHKALKINKENKAYRLSDNDPPVADSSDAPMTTLDPDNTK